MSISVKILGFDKATELLAVVYDVPPSVVTVVKLIAGVPELDADLLTVYPLNEDQVKAIADATHISLSTVACDYSLESSDV